MTRSNLISRIKEGDRDRDIYFEEWMSEDQWSCAKLAAEFMRGFHRVENLRKYGRGVAFDLHAQTLNTFDFDGLTRLVALAHRDLIRAGVCFETREMEYEGHEYEASFLSITLFQRKSEGAMHERHPSLNDLIRTLSQMDRKGGGE